MSKKKTGFSLLETALVLPAILMFALGSIDVATYFRSYSAAKQAVNAGLRCLYPSDAVCVSIAPVKTIPQNEFYIPPFFSHHYNYDGVEKKLLLPDYEYGPVQARVLDTVSYIPNRQTYVLDKPWYLPTGTAKVLTQEVPRLRGESGRTTEMVGGTKIAVRSSDVNNSSFARCSSLRVSDNDDDPNGTYYGEPHASFTFKVPDMPAELANDPHYGLITKCAVVQGGAFNKRGIECYHDPKLEARLFFKLNGQTITDANSSADAHLNLRISFLQNGKWVGAKYEETNQKTNKRTNQVGGQAFSSDYSGNFFPRGFTYDEARIRLSPQESFDSYGINLLDASHIAAHGRIQAPWGSTVKVDFLISKTKIAGKQCPAGRNIRWNIQASDIDIRYATQTILSKQAQCTEQVFESRCKEYQGNPISICSSDTEIDMPMIGNVLGSKIFAPSCNQPQGIVHSHTSSCREQPITKEQLFTEFVQSTGTPNQLITDYRFYNQGALGCDVLTPIIQSCPVNYGATSTNEASRICPSANAIDGTEQWNEKTVTVVNAGQIKVDKQDCTFDPIKPLDKALLPDEAAKYQNLILPTASIARHSQMDTANTDPSLLKKDDPKYTCPAVLESQRQFNETARQEFSSEEWQRLLASDFNGPAKQLGCAAYESLKGQALTIGMSDKSFFQMTSAVPIPNSKYQVTPTSIDRCMSVESNQSLAATNLRQKVPGGPYDQGVIPAACILQGTNRCIIMPAGVRQIESSGQASLDTAYAEVVARKTVEAFLPSACPECIMVTKPKDAYTEEELKHVPFELSVAVKQPLFVSKILGKDSVTVEYKDSRSWEGKYAM